MFNREFIIKFTAGDVVKFLLFSPVVVGVAYFVVCLPWGSPNAPAWVQAVGSVGAILVAAWAALHSSQISQRMQKEAQAARFEVVDRAIYEIANNTVSALKVLISKYQENPDGIPSAYDFVLRRLRNDLGQAREIKLLDLPSTAAIRTVLEISLIQESCIKAVEMLPNIEDKSAVFARIQELHDGIFIIRERVKPVEQ